MSNITLYDSKNKAIRLTDRNYLTSGGEGHIYFENGLIYKVYNDQKYQKLQDKIAVLQKVTATNIAKPLDTLFTKDGIFSGIILPYVDGDILCRAFANHWRNTNNFGIKESLQLIDGMRRTTAEVHQLGIVMVDANETNWLIKGVTATAIDVDSWQTKDYPAIAVMPSIRDYNVKAFTKDTDWFSFGIVTFQLLTGIHPYKGTHPNYGKGSLEQRMRDRVSVFDPAIKLPAATRSFKDIPQKLLNWYEQTFNSSVRTEPPSVNASIVNQNAVAIHYQAVSNQMLKVTKVGELDTNIMGANNGFIISKNQVLDSYSKSVITGLSEEDILAILAKTAAIIRFNFSYAFARLYVKLENKDNLVVRNLENGLTTSMDITASALWVASNRLFATTKATNGLLEIAFLSIQDKITAISAQRWPVQTLSSRFFRNVIVQDCLGSAWVSIAVKDGFLSAPAPDLKGYTIMDGFGVDTSNIWLSAIQRSTGDTVRLQLTYAINKFALQHTEIVDEMDIDAATNANGVGVLRDSDNLIAVKGNGRKVVTDVKLDSHLKLFSTQDGIGAYQGKQVFNLSLIS